MIPATWKKIFADLWVNKARAILASLSIAVGVFAVGVMVTSMVIVKRDMEADYQSVNPHTARIYCQDFGDELLNELRGLPEVESVDASYNIWVKIASTSDKLYPINLNSISSLDDVVVDRVVLEEGSPILADGEIYLERQGAEGMGLVAGDPVTLTLNDGQTTTLNLAGTVHDVNGNPFLFTSSTSGFVTPATMKPWAAQIRTTSSTWLPQDRPPMR
jgi:putative ABC transport system permease protein